MATFVKHFSPVLFNNFEGIATSHQHSFPAVNVIEDENTFKLALAAPGLSKEDFKINVHENTLTISSEKKQEVENTTEKYTRKEFSFSTFQRTFTLPKTVDSDKIVANYKDGILNLDLPKKEEAKPKEPRLIEIA